MFGLGVEQVPMTFHGHPVAPIAGGTKERDRSFPRSPNQEVVADVSTEYK